MYIIVSYFGNDSEVSIASSSSPSSVDVVVVVVVVVFWLSAFELVFFVALIRSIKVAWGRRAYRLISHDSRIFLKWGVESLQDDTLR